MFVRENQRSWCLAVLAALALAFIASLPQIYLCYARGSNWNGSFSYFDTDELAYCAYENAIIDGRPRRNDPYNGKDQQSFETLFSIQFIPPHVLAGLAKPLNLSASKTFVFLVPIVVTAACLIIFKLVTETTGNSALGIASSVAVLCFATFALNNPSISFLPFLRRYVPALPFPICLAMFLFVWKSLTDRRLLWLLMSGLCFVVLVYSYFFLWTAVGAWFLLTVILFLLARPNEWRPTLKTTGVVGLFGAVALVPYLTLVSQRARTMDESQLLELTRTPDLFRAAEIIGLAILIVVYYLAKKGRIEWRQPSVLFLLSLALAPLAILNQQLITGRSLQPFHYTQFIANYMVTIAIFILVGVACRWLPRWIPVALTVGSLAIAVVLATSVARSTLAANVLIDQKREVALRLKRENNDRVVFASDALMTMLIPTEARNPMLWSRYSYIFGNITAEERKWNYYKYLYYSGFDEKKFVHAMNYDFTSRVEVFGAERTNPSLTVSHQAITPDDIAQAYKEYDEYCRRFTRVDAANPTVGYAIVLTNVDLTNFDRWYSRDDGERVGDFVVYKVSLK